MIVKTKNRLDHLCDHCKLSFPTCPAAIYIDFGRGKGNDNVIECSECKVRLFHKDKVIIIAK